MAGMTSEDKLLFQVLTEIGIFPQLCEMLLMRSDRAVIALLQECSVAWCCFIFSLSRVHFTTPSLLAECVLSITAQVVSLPNIFKRDSIDLRFDMFEWKLRLISLWSDDFVSFASLCGYLSVQLYTHVRTYVRTYILYLKNKGL